MNPIAQAAEATLHSHPHAALKLPELLELLTERVDRGLTISRLRTLLEGQPERFRILESWRGRWRPHVVGEWDNRDQHAWVVSLTASDALPDASRESLRLRESVRWLARSIDGRSRMDVSRWYAIVLSERSARKAVARRAA